ncbi:MAG: peptide ABC transporter substrate-binding protein [Rhabdochlamydiaceae bacterium]|nr:peptide ABC transporter substrate-binding protein [Candidatus Amphrikana amoebophyrae]
MNKLLFLLLTFTCIVGCKKIEHPKKTTPLKVNFLSDPATLDPRKAADFVTATLQFYICEGLTRCIPSAVAANGLAKEISISENRLVYTFKLRNTKWSDNTPLTSYDFAKSWTSTLDPNFLAPNAFLLYPILNAQKAKEGLCPLSDVGIATPDSKTLIITLHTPTPPFLEMISFCSLFPIQANLEHDSIGSNSIGPYTISEYKQGNYLRLKKNPNYWDAKNVTLQEIYITLVQDEMTAYQMYELGELDFIGTPFSSIPTEIATELRKTEQFHTQALCGTTFISFNLKHPPFSNYNFRQAIFHSIDKQVLVQKVTQLGDSIAHGMVPPKLYDSKHLSVEYPNPKLAKIFLKLAQKELDYTIEDFNNLTLYFTNNDILSKVAPIIQNQIFENLGIQLKIRPFSHPILMHNLTTKTYDIAICSCFAQYYDPLNILERFNQENSMKNYPSFHDDNFSAILDSSHYIKDKKQRKLSLSTAEQILIENRAVIPLYHPKSTYMYKPTVYNIQSNPTGGIYLNQVEKK